MNRTPLVSYFSMAYANPTSSLEAEGSFLFITSKGIHKSALTFPFKGNYENLENFRN